jgi:hypothetical protein
MMKRLKIGVGLLGIIVLAMVILWPETTVFTEIVTRSAAAYLCLWLLRIWWRNYIKLWRANQR